jgi:hypothetical protein
MDNMDNMDNISHTFNRYKNDFQPLTVGENFENQVFKKIKRKKTERKIAASAALILVVCAALFIARGIVFQKDPGFGTEDRTTFAANDTGTSSNENSLTAGDNNSFADPGTDTRVREEVPVMGEVIFSSSDRRANYAVQQVSYTEDRSAI